MDAQDDTWKFKCMLVVGVLFLISCFMCYDELVYLVSGQEAVATVAKDYDSRATRGRTRRTVEYSWTEPDGTARRDMFSPGDSWAPAADGKLPIRYTPGDTGRSRPVGRVPWAWVGVFLASVAAIGVFGFLMWRESRADDRPRRR
ncbi:MAG: hypothetical protein K2V38_00920 [Gemmataceae bacterium]|nr:hypothetical protein [Gemmataceae bacterium]